MNWIIRRRRPAAHVLREVRDEFESHIALRIEENLARGMSPEDARREATARFGAVRNVEAESVRIRKRRFFAGHTLASDLRQAWIGIRRAPLVPTCGALVVVVGLTTAFSALLLRDALLGRPPIGVRNPASLYSALDSFNGERPVLTAYAVLNTMAAAAPDARPFGWSHRTLQVIHGADGRPWPSALVTRDYFGALGTHAHAGRLLHTDDVAARRHVAVVSLRMARAIADPPAAAVGRPLTINGQPFEIVGVAQRGFHGLQAGDPVELWLPVTVEPAISTPRIFPDGRVVRGYLDNPTIGWMRGAVRVPRGGTADELATRLTHAVKAASTTPQRDAARRVLLHPRPWISPFAESDQLQTAMRPIGWSVLLALFLTAACLSSLFVGRVLDRRRELSTRLVLGAARRHLLRLVLLEILLVAAFGAAISVPASQALLTVVGGFQLVSGVTIRDAVVVIDERAAALLAVLAIAVAAAAAIAPTVLAFRLTALWRIESPRATAAGTRFRRLLMAAQVSVGCALLSGSALLTRSLDSLLAQPIFFDARAVAYVETDPAGAGLDDNGRSLLLQRLLQQDLPGATVALADEAPYGGQSTLFVVGEQSARTQHVVTPTTRIAGPYFEALGVRLMAGRPFTAADSGSRVAIISAPLGELLWPGTNPVGRTVRVGGARGEPHQVIGVVPGLRDVGLRGAPTHRLYLPLTSVSVTLTVLARTEHPKEVLPAVLSNLRTFDQRLIALRSGTLDELMRRTLEQRRLLRLITATIGIGSLLLVAAGVWGLSHGSLRRRWREFGIRQALGAKPGEVARLALADARFVLLAGGVLGIAAAWQFGQVIRRWLFGVPPYDPVSIGTAVLLVAVATVMGGLWPARQAMRIDASELLRQE